MAFNVLSLAVLPLPTITILNNLSKIQALVVPIERSGEVALLLWTESFNSSVVPRCLPPPRR